MSRHNKIKYVSYVENRTDDNVVTCHLSYKHGGTASHNMLIVMKFHIVFY
jgi:hypothetical protein